MSYAPRSSLRSLRYASQQTNMGVYRFKSQKVMKYNFKQKRWKKRKNLLVEKGEQNGRNYNWHFKR